MDALDALQNLGDGTLSKAVLESFVDGILILTEDGQLVYDNEPARQICCQLNQGIQSDRLPKPIWRLCQALIENRQPGFNSSLVMESEVSLDRFTGFRLRARWLTANPDRPYLIVMLEDRHLALTHLAVAEARKYHLTHRETEIWLLRRCNYSRKEIAVALHVSLDTIKKHLKNISLKQQAHLSEVEWQQSQAKGA